MVNLDILRQKIESIDIEIASLLIDRHKTVKKIGNLKEKQGISVYQKEREEALMKKVLKKGNTKSIKDYLKSIFLQIFKLSRKLQKK